MTYKTRLRFTGAGLLAPEEMAAEARATDTGAALSDSVQQHRLSRLTGVVKTRPPRHQDRLAGAIENLLRLLAYDAPAANRICRYCGERICTPEICPTEHWVREQAARAARFGPQRPQTR